MRTFLSISLQKSLFFFLIYSGLNAQVGINTTNPSPASVLDISASSDGTVFGGILPPRVSLAARNNISVSPSDDGLLVFLSEGNTRCLQIYDGAEGQWENVFCMPVNQAPVASAVNYNGNLHQGATLTATFVYSDTEGDPQAAHTYNWYRADDILGNNQVLLQSGPLETYALSAADIGYQIAVEVIPEAGSGSTPGLPELSVYRGPVAGPLNGGMIISEIADPLNDASARFIELTNASNALLDISGWQLSIYANANVTPAATHTFPDFTFIPSGASFVLAQNAAAFNTVYGFPPDAAAALFNSNGDDNFELRDQNGMIVDLYGQPGTDQSGTCADFTNGRALRETLVVQGSTIWNEAEWIVRADIAVGGCTNHANTPQNAPVDFSPGTHPN